MASKKRAPTHLHKHPCDTVLATHHKPYQQPESCFFVCLFVAAHDNQKTREEVHALNVAKFFVVDTSRVTGTANREGHTTDCEKTTVGWMGSMWSKKCLKRYACTSVTACSARNPTDLQAQEKACRTRKRRSWPSSDWNTDTSANVRPMSRLICSSSALDCCWYRAYLSE